MTDVHPYRVALEDSTDRLNQALLRAQNFFRSLKLGVSSAVVPPGSKSAFGFQKHDGTWQLVWYAENKTAPLVSAPRNVRLIATEHLQDLYDALIEAASNERAVVDEAVRRVDQFIASKTKAHS